METTAPPDGPSRREVGFVVGTAVLTMALTSIPYLAQWLMAAGRWVPLVSHDVLDYGVYLSWMRLASEGVYRDAHLFSGGGQPEMLLSLPYLVLGVMAGLLHLSLPAAFFLGRVVLCGAFVAAGWWFIRIAIDDWRQRCTALLFVCFSSGLGWISLHPYPVGSIDSWQPESNTFLSLYTDPHYTLSLILLLGAYGNLLLAERDDSWSRAAAAGLCWLLLALVHPFDLVTAAIVFILYLGLRMAPGTRSGGKAGRLATFLVLSVSMALPGLIYMGLQYRTNTVMANKTHILPSGTLLEALQGFGLLLPLAAFAVAEPIFQAESNREEQLGTARSAVPVKSFLVCWFVGSLLAMYLPLNFQRRLIEGAHVPLAILAAQGGCMLLARCRSRLARAACGVALCVLLPISLVAFVAADIHGFSTDDLFGSRVYLRQGEVQAVKWAGRRTVSGSAVQPIPWVRLDGNGRVAIEDATLAVYSPMLSGQPVYIGHWAETSDYEKKLRRLVIALTAQMGKPAGYAMLRDARIEYLIYSQKREAGKAVFPCFADGAPLPPYLERVYVNADSTVYRVRPPAGAGRWPALS